MRLSTLVEGLVDALEGTTDPEITHLTVDVNEVRPGALFVARRNWYGDTHALVGSAIERGASAVLVSEPMSALGVPVALARAEDPALGLLSRRFYGAPTGRLQVYGVTGTNGKTSVTWMVEHALRALGERPALMGTLGYRFEGAEVPAANTTPDALVIHRFAADALARGATALVLEVSSHALAIGRVAGVCFDSVGFTNLSHDHLDFHGDPEAYLAAKRRLFVEAISESRAWGKQPSAAICVDGPAGRRILGQDLEGVPSRAVAPVEPFPPGAWQVREVGDRGLGGMDAALTVAERTHEVRLPIVGDFNLANAGLAAAMIDAVHPGHVAETWASLGEFDGVPGRLEQVVPGVFVDYAHTPDAVARAAATLRTRTTAPLTVVVGCGGARDRAKRPVMAGAAVAAADRVIVTSDNPRDEPPDAIIDEMVAGLEAPYTRRTDRSAAIAEALRVGGMILVAGKGHERVQKIGQHAYHFDDREEVRRLARAQAEGLDPAQAPLAWGWAIDAANPVARANRAIAEARARPGGLWVVAVEATDQALEHAAALVGHEAVLLASYPECGGQLAAGHRVLLVDGPAPAALMDCVINSAGADWAALYRDRAARREADPPAPAIPTLGR